MREALKKENKDGKLLVVLDDDDLLNPNQTLERYKLGIDMNYLVKHFG